MSINSKSVHKLRWFSVLVSLFISWSAEAQSGPVFSVYTGPRSLDGAAKDPSGQNTSNPTELFVQAMFREAELEYTFTTIPWSRAQQAAQSDANVLIYAMLRLQHREDLYEWIGRIYPVEFYLFALKGKLSDPPSTLDEARQLRIGLARRSAVDDMLTGLGFTGLVYTGDPTRSPVLLERGRVDLWPMTLQEAEGIIRDYELEEDALVPLVKLEAVSTATYFVVSKQTDPELVERLRHAYTRLVEDGVYAELFEPEASGSPLK